MADMSPDEIQALLSTNGDQDALSSIQEQIAQAQRLRTKSVPQLNQVGDMALPNYGGMAANLIDTFRGKKEEQAATAKREKLYQNQAMQLQKYLSARFPSAAPGLTPPGATPAGVTGGPSGGIIPQSY